MAFGYTRLPGTARRYRNDATGEVISRMRYTRIVDELIQEHVDEETELGAEAIADTARLMADIEDSLRRREVAERPETSQRQSAGLRRRNALLEAYYEQDRLRGGTATKAELGKSAEFNDIMRELKGQPNPRNNPNIRDQNRFRRRKALDRVGGDAFFRKQYERMYGGRRGGHGPRRDSKGNPTRRRA